MRVYDMHQAENLCASVCLCLSADERIECFKEREKDVEIRQKNPLGQLIDDPFLFVWLSACVSATFISTFSPFFEKRFFCSGPSPLSGSQSLIV